MPNQYKFIEVDYNPFQGKDISKIAPSTESQKEIYVSTLIGGEKASLAYNESITLALDGELDFIALKKAFQVLVNRHEALRSSISKNGESIVIYNNVDFELALEDITGKSAAAQKDFIDTLKLYEVHTPFNLNDWPLFRATVVKISAVKNYLFLTGHHIVFDGWSIGVILQELSAIYSGIVGSVKTNLLPAKQISAYAKEEVEYQRSEDYKKTEAFWLNDFNDENFIFDFPADLPRPAQRTYDAKRLDFKIDQQTIKNLKAVGLKSGLTLVSTLLVAFELLLAKIAGQKQVVVGLPTAGQAATNNQNLIGHCVNMLPLKSSVNQNISFAEHLNLRKDQIFDAYENQRFTFGSLLKDLKFQRDSSRISLVPIAFNVDLGYDNGVSFAGLAHQLSSTPRAYETFEIFLNISGSEEDFKVEWSFNTQLFKEASIHKFQDNFIKLIKNISENPTIALRHIGFTEELITAKKSRLNDTQVAYPKEKTLDYFLRETAKKYPNRTAVSTLNDKITYQQLDEKSNQFANYLQQNGISIGDKVGLAVDRSVDMVVALIGILKAGAAYLPFDPSYPTDRIEYMLEDAAANFLITTKTYENKFKSNSKVILLENVLLQLPSFDKDFQLIFNSDHLLYILHTSGSTGKPKGVQIRHYNVVNLLLSVQDKFGIKPDDKMLAITTISFDIAEVEIFLPLITGAEVMLADKDDVRDAERLIDLLQNQDITFMQATPSGWQMILDAGWDKKMPIKILCGGEPMTKDLAQKLTAQCDELWNVYGPTETTIYSTVNRIHADDEIISIGKPLNNTQIYFLDENLHQVEDGDLGEIYIAGDGVSKGYINKYELTKERYLPNPFNENGKSSIMYRTGDLGKLMPNGYIQCLGRVDHQVKIRGYRIELEEIEQNLIKQSDISKAVVTAIELQAGNQQLAAYLIPANYQQDKDYQQEIKKWKAELAKALPPFMVPSFFYILDKFPLTPNGKTDRKALPTPLKPIEREVNDVFVEASTTEEKLILKIWSEALKIEKISITDNFFELGGHSLLAVQVMQKVENTTGIKLPLASLFEHPNIQKLASLLVNHEQKVKWNSLVKIKPSGSKTPLYLIHGSGLNVLAFYSIAKYVDEEQPIYGLQAQGLDGKEIHFNNLTEIAKVYVDEMVKDNPNGPYSLIGYSLGGIIALEMAQQLKKLGKSVVLVGAVDTYIKKDESYHSKIEKILTKILRQPKKLLFFSKQFLGNPSITINYQLAHIKHFVDNAINKANFIKEETLEDKINNIYDKAYEDYRLTPYDDVIYLFKVQKRIYFLDDPHNLGWLPYAPKGLRIRSIPGDHATFFLPPNDKKSAEIFQQALNEAEK